MEQPLPAPSRSRECVFLKAPTVPSLGQARYAVSGPGSSLEPLMDVGDKSPAPAPGAGAGAAPVRHVSHSSQNSPVGLKLPGARCDSMLSAGFWGPLPGDGWGCSQKRGSGRTDPVGSPEPSECPQGPLCHSGRCWRECSATWTRRPLPSGSSRPLESRETEKGAVEQSGSSGEGQVAEGPARGTGLSRGLAFPLHLDR